MKTRACAISTVWLAIILTGGNAGCATKVQYLDNSEAFKKVKDKTFALRQDSYVFRFIDRPKAMPQVASNPGKPGVGLDLLPKHGDTNLIGKSFRKEMLIDDVIPKGTRFQVVALRREDRVEMGPLMAFEIRFEGLYGHKWPRLDARWFTDNRTPQPELVAECVSLASK